MPSEKLSREKAIETRVQELEALSSEELEHMALRILTYGLQTVPAEAQAHLLHANTLMTYAGNKLLRQLVPQTPPPDGAQP